MKKYILILLLAIGAVHQAAEAQQVVQLRTQRVTGTITTQNLVPAGVATANSAVEIDVRDANTVTIQTVGTYTGGLSVQFTVDGTNWETNASATALVNVVTGAVSSLIGSAAQEIYQFNCAGYVKVRVTALAAVTGTATVTLKASNASAVIPAVPLAAGTNTAGNFTPAPSASIGFATYHKLISAGTTNATSVKTSAGTISFIHVSNTGASVRWLKIYNKASAPTVGTDVPVFTILIPIGFSGTILNPAMGLRLSTGIAYAITASGSDADNSAVGAGEVVVNINYL